MVHNRSIAGLSSARTIHHSSRKFRDLVGE